MKHIKSKKTRCVVSEHVASEPPLRLETLVWFFTTVDPHVDKKLVPGVEWSHSGTSLPHTCKLVIGVTNFLVLIFLRSSSSVAIISRGFNV
ncbi:Protein of unknown function [Cotesia congregata]|uniref:Uncharacterized protein n=1 Tax=Cotesia congregata TaxID=51543 RepID=A0A8J2E3W9_COTCN|nr:Protein of unknown function [Cotesia congregata]